MEATTVAPAPTHLIVRIPLIADALAISCVTGIALLARLVTAGLYSSGISTDEYRYSIIAQEWLRILAGGSSMSLQALVVHHPLVPVAAGLASAIGGADALSAGRALQLVLNAGTVPILYLLMRSAGLRTAAAFAGAAGLAAMPGYWEASATFLPDSQLAFLSTLVFLGIMLGLRGRVWGHWLAALALGSGFLTKEHLPLVLLPSVVALWAVALSTRVINLRQVLGSLLALAGGIVAAVVVAGLGVGIPRAIILAVMQRSESAGPISNGLPPPAPALESATGSSWVSSLIGAILNRDINLDWFSEAFGIQIVGGAIAVLGLVGSGVLLSARSPDRNDKGAPPCWVMLACLAVPLLLFMSQIVARSAWDALLAAACLLTAFAVINSGRVTSRPVENDWPRTDASSNDRAAFWALLAGLAAYILATIGFFALELEQVSFLPRMFLPIMPACAFFFGIGSVGIGRMLRPFTERLSAAALVALGGVVIGLIVPGGPIRKVGAVFASGILAGALHWSGLGKRLPHTQTIAVLVTVAALLIGTPALTTIARGRDFRGFPDDPYYRVVTGGIRVATFRSAEPWLQSNVAPGESVITSKPYQVSWHGGLGFVGYRATRVWDERANDRRQYLSDALLQQTGYDWIIDFNQFVVQGESSEGPAFEEDYRWLQTRPYLREAYAATDSQGRILLYAFRHVGM